MAIILTAPITWEASELELKDIQANIVKGHGRKHVRILLLKFKEADTASAAQLKKFSTSTKSAGRRANGRAFIKALTDAVDSLGQPKHPVLTSAYRQLWDSKVFKSGTGQAAGAIVTFALTKAGYATIGSLKAPTDTSFAGQTSYYDAVVLVAAGSDRASEAEISQAASSISSMALKYASVREESGRVIEEHGRSIEPFGYTDGISGPNMLTEDKGTDPSNTVLLADPAAPASYGSYFIYQKIRQHRPRFDLECQKLVDSKAATNTDQAGAQIIGRFRDGTPIVNSTGAPEGLAVPDNSFGYSAKPAHAAAISHVEAAFARTAGSKQLARRGIPFGPLATGWYPMGAGGDPVETAEEALSKAAIGWSAANAEQTGLSGLAVSKATKDKAAAKASEAEALYKEAEAAYEEALNGPEEGLHFMCYSSDIAAQFEAAQTAIGAVPGTAGNASVALTAYATPEPAEYFFAPSISGLRAL